MASGVSETPNTGTTTQNPGPQAAQSAVCRSSPFTLARLLVSCHMSPLRVHKPQSPRAHHLFMCAPWIPAQSRALGHWLLDEPPAHILASLSLLWPPAPTSLEGLQALRTDRHGAGFGERVRDDLHDTLHHLETTRQAVATMNMELRPRDARATFPGGHKNFSVVCKEAMVPMCASLTRA